MKTLFIVVASASAAIQIHRIMQKRALLDRIERLDAMAR